MNIPFYTVYDIETTGLSAACQCEIIEFAGIQLDENLNEVNRLHIYIKPYKKLPKKIIELTGITNEQLAGCENRFTALPKIRSFIGNTISVCHNADFDVNFISTMCLQQGLDIIPSYICTMKSYKAITGEKTAKLFMACEKFGVKLENAHTAIADTEATVEVFKHLMNLDKDNTTSKMFRKDYDSRAHYVSLMCNVARQNPNKKIRDTLCNMPIEKDVPLNVQKCFDLFERSKSPKDIAEMGFGKFYDISQLFLIWLNTQRLPKFIRFEDFSLNRQVKTMIQYSENVIELHNLHKTIYDSENIDYGIYNYFWIKNKRYCDKNIIHNILFLLFYEQTDLELIVNALPHISPSTIALAFCNFAVNNKENYRDYIAKNLINKTELENAIQSQKTHFTDDEIKINPSCIKTVITAELNERHFFKFMVV